MGGVFPGSRQAAAQCPVLLPVVSQPQCPCRWALDSVSYSYSKCPCALSSVSIDSGKMKGEWVSHSFWLIILGMYCLKFQPDSIKI